MFLRDLILRRKPTNPVVERSELALAAIEEVADLALSDPTPPEEAVKSEAGAVLQLGPFRDSAETSAAEVIPAEGGTGRHGVVLRRMTALTLPADAGDTARQEAILDRLCIVHDPNEVVVSGVDRTARIVMNNRRIMSARFSLAGRVDEVFLFQKRRASKRAARDVAASLAAFCAEPVELVVTEQPVSGVFDAVAGLAVSDLAATGPFEAEPEMVLQAVAG